MTGPRIDSPGAKLGEWLLHFSSYSPEYFGKRFNNEEEFATAIVAQLTEDLDKGNQIIEGVFGRREEVLGTMHNADDIILEPGEIDFFTEVFGDRATIYPVGGHCGNMDYRDNVAHMVNVFRQ